VLSLYGDIRFASDQAKFTTAFARRGLIAEYGMAWMQPRLAGVSHALDLLYSGRLIWLTRSCWKHDEPGVQGGGRRVSREARPSVHGEITEERQVVVVCRGAHANRAGP
jgi:hypothetical protein